MSIWGVQRAGQIPTIVKTVGDADVTLTAGSAVAGFTPAAALIAPQRANWAYVVEVFAVIVLGSSAPTALVVTLATATPATIDTLTVPASLLVNSAILALSFVLVGTGSETLYFPTGDTPTVNFNCTTNAATLKAHSRAVFSFAYVGD
jgi:hypothetical protein